jgi:dCMP deaminase
MSTGMIKRKTYIGKMGNRIDWQEYFMILAKMVALRSTCHSRPVGAVLVKDKNILCTGYNGAIIGETHCTDGVCFRRKIGVVDSNKSDYCKSVHAEINVISQAAKHGISIEGSTLYITLAPCYNCFKALVNSGVKKVFYEHKYESVNKKRDEHWASEIRKNIRIEKLIIQDRVIQEAIQGLKDITSKRKLKSE